MPAPFRAPGKRQIDWSNPLTRGLIFDIDHSSGYAVDLVGTLGRASVAVPNIGTKAGGAQEFTGTGYRIGSGLTNASLGITDKITLWQARGIPAGDSNQLTLGTSQFDGAFGLGVYSGGLIVWHGGGFTFANGAFPASPDGINQYCGTADGATCVGYVNGVVTGSGEFGGNIPETFGSIGINTQSADGLSGGSTVNIARSRVFNRALSPAEIASLRSNPDSIYKRAQSFPYAALAAASTAVSGGITWTEASDSVAAAGTAAVSGTAAWTEASDSAALAGSVGSAVSIGASWTEAADTIAIASTARVNAAGAWTEAADTAAIAASASITVAAAWTEQADTISMAGSAGNGIAANITWTEAADVTAVAGSIQINAAGSWTEAGDSAAIVVNVAQPQSAALSWTEAPDTVSIAAIITAAPVVGTIAWTEQADIAAKPTYPGFYSFTLMRSDPISSAGAMSSSAPAFTLMRADSIASSSKMSDAPINQTVNLI